MKKIASLLLIALSIWSAQAQDKKAEQILKNINLKKEWTTAYQEVKAAVDDLSVLRGPHQYFPAVVRTLNNISLSF